MYRSSLTNSDERLTVPFPPFRSVCVISALRLHAIRTINFADITYSVAMAQVWSALEPALAITLAYVPVLRPVLGGAHSATGTALGLGHGGFGPGGGRGHGRGHDYRRPKSRRGLLSSPPSSAAVASAPATAPAPATSGTEEQKQHQHQHQHQHQQLEAAAADHPTATTRRWFQPRPDDGHDDDFELRDDDGAGSEYRLRPYCSTRHNNIHNHNHVAISTHSVDISTQHHATAEMERRGRQRGACVRIPAAASHGIDVRREWDINSEH